MKESLTDNTTISHYRILSLLGAGGMGEVYLAHDTKIDRRVALKILPEAFAQDIERMRRFVQEAKSASALNHPNIITIHEIGDAEGSHFIATEYVEGEKPNYATAHHWLGEDLSNAKRFDDGLVELRRAEELDPLYSGLYFCACLHRPWR